MTVGFRVVTLLCLSSLLITPAVDAGDVNWPSFRGPNASGVADGSATPATWNVEASVNVRWKTPIPGLAHSSPIVWGDRVIVTTAVSDDPNPYLRIGLYGESPDHPEKIDHDFRVYCLDKNSGKVIWERTAHRGIPQVKRHIKSTHANSTPATDGKHVVAFFGSEGLYCYDLDGKLLWKKDLGYLDAGAFNAPEVQWGFGSSPIIYKKLVIILCDVNNQSFIAAFDVDSGSEVWRTLRDEVPTWGTPTVHEGDGRTQVIVNGFKHIGGYEAVTGKELWRLTGLGDVPVPTPVVAHDIIFITNAHGRGAPVYAIRTTATGDISLKEGEARNEHIAWSRLRVGNYMQTPLVYGDLLYCCRDYGILSCYDARTGVKQYKKRLATGVGFSASPVAADGKIYFTSEEGDVYVVKTGPEYELLGKNNMGEVCMATPAVSEGTLFFRTRHHLVAIAEQPKPVTSGSD